MGWRLRKIFNIGPFRWSLSQGGVGTSWGIPGLRIGVSPSGKKYICIGMPGTGLYFFKYLPEDSFIQGSQQTNNETKPTSKSLPNEPWWKQKGFQ
jgi:hypothetical protein